MSEVLFLERPLAGTAPRRTEQKIHKLLLNHEQLFRATNICRIISFGNSSLHPMASAIDLAKRALVALGKFLAGVYSLYVAVKR